MMKLLLIVSVLVLASVVESKKFTRCELVRELRNQGFPEDKLRDWVCLVEHESSRNTSKIGKVNKNGSRDYGLFQINDKYWCSNTSTPGKDCNVTCSELLSNDITKISSCAKKVYKRHQFQAWYGWRNNCQTPSSLPDISTC